MTVARVLTRVFACALVVCSCAAQPRYVWYSSLPVEAETAPRTNIEPGDSILVQVASHPEVSGEFVVGATGTYNHPLAGVVDVKGLEPAAAASLIKDALSRYVEVTSISVTLIAYRPLRITVLGEVGRPGTYEVPVGSGLLPVLSMAGGLSEFADEDQIYVLREKPQPMRVRFRYSDLIMPEAAAIGFRLRQGDAVLVE